MVACPRGSSIVTPSITDRNDDRHLRISSERALHRTQQRVEPSKELNMKTHGYDAGRGPLVPQPADPGQPAPQTPNVPRRAASAAWLVPAALIVLSLVPVIAGGVRIAELSGGAEVTPDNARFVASPLPVVLHIISVTLYSILGAFQFAPAFRRRRRGWHRAAGRILIPSGLIAALSGLWMTLFYPWHAYDGAVVYGLRLLFGSAMLVSLLLGTAAIRRRDFVQHGAWMMRGYAIGLGAGTQVLTHLPWFLFPAIQGELTRALFMAAGWVINLAVAEWIIRWRPAAPARAASAVIAPLQ